METDTTNNNIPAANNSGNNQIPEGVLYRPGEEPEALRNRMQRLFAKLDEAYPDKVIVGLNKDHHE